MDGWMRDDGTQTDMTASRVWDADWGPEGGQRGGRCCRDASVFRMQDAGGEEEEEGGFLSSFTPTPSPEGVYGFLFFISLNSSVQWEKALGTHTWHLLGLLPSDLWLCACKCWLFWESCLHPLNHGWIRWSRTPGCRHVKGPALLWDSPWGVAGKRVLQLNFSNHFSGWVLTTESRYHTTKWQIEEGPASECRILSRGHIISLSNAVCWSF